ncbi:N-acetyltransferase [Breoghania sp.]|uniref:GNAT family N-acetyltransferase n=1 Tax=Breoghania sp. TaxID=2065378 RepID=UPI002AAB2B0B|nr:N-acetyltransferase [Breoghania sp.]
MSEPQTPTAETHDRTEAAEAPVTSLAFRPAGPNDAVLIGRLVHEAFERGDETKLVGKLRTSDDFALELVATDGANILGHVQFTHVRRADGADTPSMVILAPLSVRPDMQRKGIGSALVEAALDRLRRDGIDMVMVLGDPAYYTRFGFSAALGEKFDTPWPGPEFMAMELREGAAISLGADDTPLKLTFPQALVAVG